MELYFFSRSVIFWLRSFTDSDLPDTDNIVPFENATSINQNKKLIRRWDSERELSLRRHRTRTTKYNRLVCINSATDRRDYVLECSFTKVSEITQCNGHYAVQGHSRSPILVPIESSYTTSYIYYTYTLPITSYYWLILTYFLSCTLSKLWLIIGHIFTSERGVPHFNAVAGVIPC